MSTPAPVGDDGAAFYAERLARARSVPPERRSACVGAFLTVDTLLSEAADVLSPAPESAARGSADEQLVAQIKLVQAAAGALEGQPYPLTHTQTNRTGFLAAQLQPLITTTSESSSTGVEYMVMTLTPQLKQLCLQHKPVSDMHTLGHLLALVYALLVLNARQDVVFCCLDLVERSLKDAGTAAAIDHQLAALRAGPAGASAAEDWQLPTAEGLRAVVLHIILTKCLVVLPW
eukprot:scaffold11.g3939.t1